MFGSVPFKFGNELAQEHGRVIIGVKQALKHVEVALKLLGQIVARVQAGNSCKSMFAMLGVCPLSRIIL